MPNEAISDPSERKTSVTTVTAQLDRILASKPFKASFRCQEFLRYVVTHAADGRLDSLRERVIGIEVFGRDPSYDKNEDSVVRVRANEVRRRISQYYAEEAGADELRIVFHPGSYVPEFVPPEPEAAAPPAPAPVRPPMARSRWLPRGIAAALALGGALLAAYLLIARTHSDDLAEAFWKPIWQFHEPVLIVVSNSDLFQLKRSTVPRGLEDDPEIIVDVPNSLPQTFSASEVHPLRGDYTGIGIAAAALVTKGVLDHEATPAMLRVADQVTMQDLRVHPAMLIGGYANSWVLRFTKDLRFHLERRSAERRVRDTGDPSKDYVLQAGQDGQPFLDYPVISRLLRTETGKPMLIASAMTQWGCQAAAEMASRPDLLAQALKNVPGWRSRNVQLLLRVRIIHKATSAPEILAVHAWQ